MIGRFGTLLLALALAAPLAAQERATAAPTTTLRGVVVDALHGDPLANTMVRLVEKGRGVLADSLGRFTFADVMVGPHSMAVKQYGYDEVLVDFDLAADSDPLRIELDPGPYAIQGFNVVADRLATMNQRLRSRRNATPVTVQALDQNRLARSSARDMLEFIELEGTINTVPCLGRGMGTACVERRGRTVSPKVYIDEAPVIGGIDQLQMYKPYELYLVELFAGGTEIRAYTHRFMDRMARRPIALIPIGL